MGKSHISIAEPDAVEALEKSIHTELAQAIISAAPHLGAMAGSGLSALSGGAAMLAGEKLREKVAGRATDRIAEEHMSRVVHHAGSAVVGHRYSMKGEDGQPHVYRAEHSSEHGVMLQHEPTRENEPHQKLRIVSHEDFQKHFGTKIKDAEPGSGRHAQWFPRSQKSETDEPVEEVQETGATEEVAQPMDKSVQDAVLHLANHLITHGPAIAEQVHHLVHHAGEMGHDVAMEHGREAIEEVKRGVTMGGGASLALAGAKRAVHTARNAAADVTNREPFGSHIHHEPGSAVVGHHYLVGGHRYHAVHSSSEGVMLDPHPTKGDTTKYGPIGFTHDEFKAHMRAGGARKVAHIQDLSDDVEKSESALVPIDAQPEDVVKAEEETKAEEVAPEPYAMQPNDVIFDITSRAFVVKSIDRGVVTLSRDGRDIVSMSENDARRFLTVPGMFVRRDGKRISVS